MAETKRCAIVTGSNKGIGFEICRQLASNGVIVVLTARDDKKGIEAMEKLKKHGLSDNVVFHQLDVTSSSSIASLVDFVKTKFGKLDILVNNAAINGVVPAEGTETRKDWYKVATQTYELAKECFETNYYGTKRMVEAFISLLQLSDSPRIVNVSSSLGQLEAVFQNERAEWAKQVLGDSENLTEGKIDGVLNEFLKDFKEGCVETKGWPASPSAYRVSKAAVNAYTRVLAKKYPNIRINCVCPGYVKTDFNHNSGVLSVEEGAASPVKVALGPADGPSGVFFIRDKMSSF